MLAFTCDDGRDLLGYLGGKDLGPPANHAEQKADKKLITNGTRRFASHGIMRLQNRVGDLYKLSPLKDRE